MRERLLLTMIFSMLGCGTESVPAYGIDASIPPPGGYKGDVEGPKFGWCGNGRLDDGEVCDDGYNDACGSCNEDCSATGTPNFCGDDIHCPELEMCDDGYTDDCGTCNADCTGAGSGALCGDGDICRELEHCEVTEGCSAGQICASCLVCECDIGMPVQVGNHPVLGANAVAYLDPIGYLSVTGTGILVVDLSDPTAPSVLDTLPVTDAIALLVHEGSLLVTTTTELIVFDVLDDASQPAETGRVTVPSTLSVAASGVYAYVAGAGDFAVVDITATDNPTVVGQTAEPVGVERGLAVTGTHVLAGHADGLVTYNVSTATAPSYAHTEPTAGAVNAVWVDGSHAFVAEGQTPGAVQIFELTNPEQPAHQSTYESNDAPVIDVAVSGDLMLVLQSHTAMEIVSILQPTNPEQIGTLYLGGSPKRLVVEVALAFIADDEEGLVIGDFSSPSGMRTIAAEYGYDAQADVVVGDGILLAANPEVIYPFIVIDPTAPTALEPEVWYDAFLGIQVYNISPIGRVFHTAYGTGKWAEWDFTNTAEPQNHLRYQSDQEGKVTTFIHATPTTIYTLGIDGASRIPMFSIFTPPSVDNVAVRVGGVSNHEESVATQMAVSGTLAYISWRDPGGFAVLGVVDFSSRSNVRMLGTTTDDDIEALAAYGSHVVMAVKTRGMRVIDAADPDALANTAIVQDVPVGAPGSDTTLDAWDLIVQGSYAYVIDGGEALQIFDIRDPTDPVWVAGHPVEASVLWVSGNLVYTSGANGIRIIRVCE